MTEQRSDQELQQGMEEGSEDRSSLASERIAFALEVARPTLIFGAGGWAADKLLETAGLYADGLHSTMRETGERAEKLQQKIDRKSHEIIDFFNQIFTGKSIEYKETQAVRLEERPLNFYQKRLDAIGDTIFTASLIIGILVGLWGGYGRYLDRKRRIEMTHQLRRQNLYMHRILRALSRHPAHQKDPANPPK